MHNPCILTSLPPTCDASKFMGVVLLIKPNHCTYKGSFPRGALVKKCFFFHGLETWKYTVLFFFKIIFCHLMWQDVIDKFCSNTMEAHPVMTSQIEVGFEVDYVPPLISMRYLCLGQVFSLCCLVRSNDTSRKEFRDQNS